MAVPHRAAFGNPSSRHELGERGRSRARGGPRAGRRGSAADPARSSSPPAAPRPTTSRSRASRSRTRAAGTSSIVPDRARGGARERPTTSARPRLRGDGAAGRRRRPRRSRGARAGRIRPDTTLVSVAATRTTRSARCSRSPSSPRSPARRAPRCTPTPSRRPAGSPSGLDALGVDALSARRPQARRAEGHGRAGRARPAAARAGAARRRPGARPPLRHRERRRAVALADGARGWPRPSERMPRPASRRCGAASTRSCSRDVPGAILTGDPVAPAARHTRRSSSPARAARPCCSNSSSAASSARADRRAPPAATSPRTCSPPSGSRPRSPRPRCASRSAPRPPPRDRRRPGHPWPVRCRRCAVSSPPDALRGSAAIPRIHAWRWRIVAIWEYHCLAARVDPSIRLKSTLSRRNRAPTPIGPYSVTERALPDLEPPGIADRGVPGDGILDSRPTPPHKTLPSSPTSPTMARATTASSGCCSSPPSSSSSTRRSWAWRSRTSSTDLDITRQHGAVADHRVHAHDGGRHPDHRLPAAAHHHPADLHRRDEPVSAGTLHRGARARLRGAAAGRVVQASGTAIMMPLLMTTVMTLVAAERPRPHMGNVSIVISVAPAIGPTISGLILSFLTWRWMFCLVLPIALGDARHRHPPVENVSEPRERPLDVFSVDPVGVRLRRARLRPQPGRRRVSGARHRRAAMWIALARRRRSASRVSSGAS